MYKKHIKIRQTAKICYKELKMYKDRKERKFKWT